MIFAEIDIGEAEGAVLAHSIPLASGVLKKGTVLAAADIVRLAGAGISRVMVARLAAGDVAEDAAAARIARAIAGAGVRIDRAFTGRVNLFAEAAGVALLDRDALLALNAIDEGLTVASLAPYARVGAAQMVATVKIIPFALPASIVAEAEQLADRVSADGTPPVAVAPFSPLRAALILTALPGSKASVMAKRARQMHERVASLGGEIACEQAVGHDIAALGLAIRDAAASGASPILVFGASAIVDRGDVVPAAVEAAGGRIVHLGMPVDPGNLLMLGEVAGVPVVGVPSCASSPKLNGFDWVLERLAAGLSVGRDEIVAMAVGGLLMEIPTRPQPRQG